MKYGKRQFGGASCEISACAALPLHMKKDIREISKLECELDQRGEGHATALMDQVCREADTKKMILVLVVKPFSEHQALNEKQLATWYCEQFDFNPIQQSPLIMARMYNQFVQPVLTKEISRIITEGSFK